MRTAKRAIIIGSGVGGMTSAILLGMAGYQVTVYEQHYRPGGCLHRFFRAGSPYDTGFHYCGGIGEGHILGHCLRHMGLMEQLRFLPLDTDGFDRLRFPELSFRVPVGLEKFKARLRSTFPHENVGIERFFQDFGEAVSTLGLYRFSSSVDPDAYLRWESTSLSEVIDAYITDPRLRAVLCAQGLLYGVPAEEAPFTLHTAVIDHFLSGAWRIEGGGDRLAKVMVKRIQSLGGTVHLKAPVSEVIVEGRDAVGVVLEDGREDRADLIVSNLHPRTLLNHLPSTAVRKAYRSRVLGQTVGTGHLGVYLQLDAPATAIGNANLYRGYSLDTASLFQQVTPGNVPFYFASAPGEGGRVRRASHNVVLLIAVLEYAQVAALQGASQARTPEYTALKDELMRSVVSAFCDDHPELAGHIVRMEASTPMSTERYIRSPQGAVYGHYHSISQMGRYRPTQFIRARNLLQVGHGVFFPGILGAALSAYYGCGAYLGLDSLLSELRTAK